MSFQLFALDALKKLDGGRVAEAFEQATARCTKDCEDRPNEEKPRKIILEMQMIPVPDTQGQQVTCASVRAAFQIKEVIPTRKSKIYNLGLKHDGRLFYSDEDATNLQQTTIGDIVDHETGKTKRTFVDDEGGPPAAA